MFLTLGQNNKHHESTCFVLVSSRADAFVTGHDSYWSASRGITRRSSPPSSSSRTTGRLLVKKVTVVNVVKVTVLPAGHVPAAGLTSYPGFARR